MSRASLNRSRALWNRTGFRLESDEVLCQVLDRGEIAAWRELYRLASGDDPRARALRKRIVQLCRTQPIGMPYFWLAAMARLGEAVGDGWTVLEAADPAP